MAGFDPNNYDIYDDNTNTALDYENAVGNTKGGTVGQHLRKISGTNHVFEWVTLNKASVGLDQVDNTSDSAKSISTATQTALDLKVDKVAGKGLSTNDYDNTEKTNVESNTTHRSLTTGNPHSVSKDDVGLGNADNTSDANKPVSTATQTALDGKVNTATGVQSADSSLLQIVGVTQATYDGLGGGRPIATLYVITDAV